MNHSLDWFRQIVSFLGWIIRTDDLPRVSLKTESIQPPPAQPALPPAAGRVSARLSFFRWLIAPEPLPESTLSFADPKRTSFLRWVLDAEALPETPEPTPQPRFGSFLSELLARDHLPPPPGEATDRPFPAPDSTHQKIGENINGTH